MDISISKLAKNVHDGATVQQALASIYCDVAAHAEELAGSAGLPVLVALTAWISKDLHVDASMAEEAHHAADCWGTVGNILASRIRLGSADSARALEAHIRAGDDGIPAWLFYDIVIDNFDDLYSNTYTYRALADIVSMTKGIPNDLEARFALEEALKLIEVLENE
ncbi:hypothetical protein [Paratractidigestivibacter sp.]|uniref:hypothetical protein n=1 Tax=Paratractidigestivibacter sp. TaxID=2847316 RepID=UPI002AC93B47|nr:hypothetical protein [Paratractidigestivibacter sp.]